MDKTTDTRLKFLQCQFQEIATILALIYWMISLKLSLWYKVSTRILARHLHMSLKLRHPTFTQQTQVRSNIHLYR